MSEANLECSICLDNFKPPIKITDCGHSFCEECILVARPQPDDWPCPFCNKIHNHPARDLARNFFAEQIVSSLQAPSQAPSQPLSVVGKETKFIQGKVNSIFV